MAVQKDVDAARARYDDDMNTKRRAADEDAVQDKPEAAAEDEDTEPRYYVHLANGDVLRVKESDLPSAGGTNAVHGHWQQGNKVHHITGIYPAETIVKD